MNILVVILLPFAVLGVLGLFLYLLSFSGGELNLREEFKLRESFGKVPGVKLAERAEDVRRSGFAEIAGDWNGQKFSVHQSFGERNVASLHFSFRSAFPARLAIFNAKKVIPGAAGLFYSLGDAEDHEINCDLGDGIRVTSSEASIRFTEAQLLALRSVCEVPEFLALRNDPQAELGFGLRIYGYPFSGSAAEQVEMHETFRRLLESFTVANS